MKRRFAAALTLTWTAFVLSLVPATSVHAQSVGAPATAAPTATMTPGERRALIDALVSKWGPYLQEKFGADAEIWRERLSAFFMNSDASNLRDAVQRDSYEGAMAALVGRGERVREGSVINARTDGADISAGKLSDLNQDLTYTPLQPCRIVDTRSTAGGAIASGGSRSFVAVNASNFSSQGGSGTNCGTLGLNATAVAVHVTAVAPSGAGYATVFPYGTSQPVSASLNYVTGAIVNNSVIAQIPNPLASFDFTIYTFAQSHFVVDIVGYFAPNLATALQCVDTADTVVAVAAGANSNATAPACATGYTQTATNCESSTWQMPFVYSSGGICSAQNNSASSADLRASRTCCRVPGR